MTALDLARAAKGRTALLAAGALVFNALVWGVSWWPFRQLQGYGLHPLWATALMYLMIATGLLVLQFKSWRGFAACPQGGRGRGLLWRGASRQRAKAGAPG